MLKCLQLASRHAVKQSRHWSTNWSMKLCWLLTTFQSDAISAHGHTSLVSDKHIPAFRFQSVSPGAGALVWFSCSRAWKWMVHRTITVTSCCSNSCCQTSVQLIDNRIYNTRLNTSHHMRRRKCHQFLRGKKNGGHVEVGLLLGGGIRHITATQAEVKEVPACVRKYCFNALIFGNISSAFRKNV